MSTSIPNAPGSHNTFAKFLFMMVLIVVISAVGYIAAYWWTFNNLTNVFNVSVLKNQVISNQRAKEVKEQLSDLGYSFQEEEFFRLNDPKETTRYHADVLGGYEPQKIEDEPITEEGYYFYDETGAAYFFSVGADNQVDPDSLVPLIAE